MESDKSDEDEHEVISKQIVDYYKKYSLSRQLPKYFSGTPLSYMPQIVKEEEINKPPLIIIDDMTSKAEVEKQSEYCQTDVEETAEPKIVSPTSSVASIRKLEWDSGADIGYSNCNKKTKLHKSFSLPTLTGAIDKQKAKPNKAKLSSHIVNVISYSSPSDHEKAAPSSSSSSSYPAEPQVQSSSSSCSAQPPSAKPPSSSSSSARPPSAKPVSSSSSSFANTLAYLKSKIGSPDAESTPKVAAGDPKNDVYSAETPFVPKIHKKSRNRVIELCVTKPISIECMNGKRKKALDKRVQTSFIEKLSKSVQTGDNSDDKVDESNSKQLVQGPKENQSVIIITYDSGSDKKTYSSNTQTDSEVMPSRDNMKESNLKRAQAKSNIATSTDSSKATPLLGQIISKKQSKSLVGDIDRSIELLQKLLKSKKYDAATKKRYIKKIVAKIVDNKYNEDSTTSSELFQPKKPENEVQQKLQENIPWCPPNMSKFGVNTFDEEVVSEKPKKKSVFTISDSRETPTSCLDSCTSLERPPNTSSGSCQSWKEDKTLSERLLEEKQKSSGDQLVKFAKKERQNQIAWINDEISHLTKLKGLLEKNGVHSTTTVYMVSQQYNKQYQSSDTRPDNGRNYVIQTELSDSTTSADIVNFNLYDRLGKKNSYQVERATMQGKNGNVVGDIEVVSDEQTTNIKVKARKVEERGGFEPKRPTLVGIGKYDTYPRSRQEEERCWPCEMMKIGPDRMENVVGAGKYRFDAPITQNAISIMKKVDEIVSKYGSKSSETASGKTSGSQSRLCPCKCLCNTTEKYAETNNRCVICCKCKTVEQSEVLSKGSCRSTCRCKNKPTADINIQYSSTEHAKSGVLKSKPSTTDEEVSSSKSTSNRRFKNRQTENVNVQCTCTEDARIQTDECTCENKGVQLDKISIAGKEDPRKCSCCCVKNLQTEDINIQWTFSENAKMQTDECECKDAEVQKGEEEFLLKCLCRTSSCRCKEKQTENVNIQCSCVENVKVQTDETKEDKPSIEKESSKSSCRCKNRQMVDANVQCTCIDNAKVQTDEVQKKKSSVIGERESLESFESPTSTTSIETETSTTVSGSTQPCLCCKKKNVTGQDLRELRKKLNDEVYPLCRPCYLQNRRCAYSYNTYVSPGYVCNCFTMVETKTLDAIKKTINDLEEDMEYCSCVDSGNRSNSSCCQYCKRKLKKTSRNRNGIAYLVTFENATPKIEEKKKEKKLEEIKIKIPALRKKKKHKDKENRKRKESRNSDDEEPIALGSPKETAYTLQEYLHKNRPDFVETAEERRHSVKVSKVQREQLGDRNKLIFLQNYQKNAEKNARRLFSEKEMKEITKRNYRKLPEVQQKLIDNREKQIRQANRLIADTFNKKLRENVLKGKRTLPTDIYVVNL